MMYIRASKPRYSADKKRSTRCMEIHFVPFVPSCETGLHGHIALLIQGLNDLQRFSVFISIVPNLKSEKECHEIFRHSQC